MDSFLLVESNVSYGNMTEGDAQLASFYCACVMVALCGMGTFGNLLSIAVFSRSPMRSSINVLLAALSTIDLLLLFIIVPIFAVQPLNIKGNRFVGELSQVLVVYAYPVSMILQTASVWLFLLITVERYLAVCHPLQVGIYCTVRRSKIAIAFVVLLSAIYNLVRFWEYKLELGTTADNGTILIANYRLRGNQEYWLWYGAVCYLLTQFLIPFLLLLSLNSRVVFSIYKAKRDRAKLTRSEKNEHRTALMMVTVIFVFTLCYSLSFILNILELFVSDLFSPGSGTEKVAYLLNDLNNTLVTLNSASTFLFYWTFSERYRLVAKWLLLSYCPLRLFRCCISDEKIDKLRRKTEKLYGSRHSSHFALRNSIIQNGRAVNSSMPPKHPSRSSIPFMEESRLYQSLNCSNSPSSHNFSVHSEIKVSLDRKRSSSLGSGLLTVHVSAV